MNIEEVADAMASPVSTYEHRKEWSGSYKATRSYL